MGEVYGPNDVIHRRGKPSPGLTPKPFPRPITPSTLEDVIREVKLLRDEIAKIKAVLKTHGIAIE